MKRLLVTIIVGIATGGLILAGCKAATPTPPPPPPATLRPATPAPAPAAKTATPRPATPRPAATTPKPAVTTPAPAKPAPKAQAMKIVLATSGSASEVGWFVAQEKGFFARAGFELDVRRGVGTNDRFAMLAKGDIDMTNISPSAGLFNAIKRGVGLKVVAAQQVITKGHHGNVAIIARKQLFDNGTLNNISKLKGKTVAISGTGGIGNIQLDKTIKKAGLKPADVNIKYMNLNEMLPALSGGQIDAALVYGTTSIQAEKQGIGKPIIYADEMYPNAIVSLWLYSENFAQNQVEAGKRWMVEYMKGVRDYNDAWRKNADKETVISAMMKHTFMKTRDWYDLISWSDIDPDGKIDMASLNEEQDWFAAQGLLPQGKVDLSQVVDSQFMDAALKQLGPYKR